MTTNNPAKAAGFSDTQLELLSLLLEEEGIEETPASQQILPRPDQTSCPLSFAQQRLWFLNQLEPNSPAYNVSAYVHISGPLQPATLQQSLNTLIQRHETLRTTFADDQGRPTAVITPTLHINIPITDLSHLSPQQQESEIQRLAYAETQQPFKLECGPLLRVKLLHLTHTEHVLFLTLHHIITDGWSMGILTREIAILCQSHLAGHPIPLPPLPIQYADFAAWQRAWLQGDVLQAQLDYWQAQLQHAPTHLPLPTDYPRPTTQTFKGNRQTLTHSAELTHTLKQLAQQENATLFMLLMAAYHLLLYRYSGQTDILVGTPIANRNRPEIEGLIGFFVNTLVMRAYPHPTLTFRELLAQLREVALGAFAHQDLPFEHLVQALQIERSLNHTPLFQVMFILQQEQSLQSQEWGLSLTPLAIDSEVAKFDLTLSVVETADSLITILEYNTDLFADDTIQRMLNHYHMLLQAIATNPDQQLSDIPLLTPAERQQLLVDWNNTHLILPDGHTFLQQFETQASQTPTATAVTAYNIHTDTTHTLTYHQLNQQANQVAHYLLSLGLQPETRVGIYLERSTEMLICLLGILKAGAAYVPLDPMFPADRLAFMIEDATIPFLITQAQFQDTLPTHNATLTIIEKEWATITQKPTTNLPMPPATALAYVIYTSGSTGHPKGVQVPHNALYNFLLGMKDTLALQATDKLFAVTTLSFDIAALELYLPLICGAELIIARRQETTDGTLLLKRLTESKSTVMQATPATWRLLLAAGWQGEPPLHVWCGGEALPRQLAQQLQQIGVTLWNLYGPTETTIWSAATPLTTIENIVPIGPPMANTQLYVLDNQLQPVPIGIPGELYIGGAGVTRGYLNRPTLTADRFIPNPFTHSGHHTSSKNGAVSGKHRDYSRLYKTGDLVRYRPNGQIEFLGRIDHQVKVRGFRIELGEIETLLEQHPAITHAVVIVREDTPGDQRLVAYNVGSKTAVSPTQLHHFLQQKLPHYMIPNRFVWLDTLPLTPNGKVNRRALPAPETTTVTTTNYVAPHTPIQETIAQIWSHLLDITPIGLHDNFFTLGGHSLLATQVVSQIRQIFQVELPLRRLFENPTIDQLAQAIQTARQTTTDLLPPPLQPVSRDQTLPLSFAQQRLWFIDQLEPNTPAYNIPTAIRLRGQISYQGLEEVFNQIRQRHENLRTRFINQEGQARFVIDPPTHHPLPLIDLQQLPTTEQEQTVQNLVQQEAQRPFDLQQGPLFRVTLLHLAANHHILLLTMHHIISDAWSMGVLLREIGQFIQAIITKQAPTLPELPIQYADFAAWQRHWLQGEVLEKQLAHWRYQLRSLSGNLNLPTDYPRTAVQTFRGAQHHFTLSPQLTQQLITFSRQEGVTLFMTLLAAFNTLLHRYTNQEDIIIGAPIANRNHTEIEGLIGFFVNTLPLRTILIDNPTFRQLLQQVKETTLNAYDYQELPLELILQDLKLDRSLSHTPLFQTVFVFQNTPTNTPHLPDLDIEIIKHQAQTAKFDLALNITPTAQGLKGVFEYRLDLFNPSTIARYAIHWQTLLKQIAEDPNQHLWNIPLITEDEEKQLETWSTA